MRPSKNLEPLGFPIAIKKSDHEGSSWTSVRAEGEEDEEEEDDEKLDMEELEYTVLRPQNAVEWNKIVSIILLLCTEQYWHIFLTFTIILTYSMGILCFFILPDRILSFMVFYAIFDAIYLFDFILHFLHRYWKKLRQKYQLTPKSNILLVIDVISLIPQERVFGLIFGFHHPLIQVCRFITYLRLYRMFNLFDEILGSVRKNRWTWFLAQYIITLGMVIHTAVCIWYSMGCRMENRCSDEHNWTEIIETTTLNVNNILRWYMICFYVAVNFISNTGFGDFYATRVNEGVYCIITMIIGYLLISTLIAILTVQLITVDYRKFQFAFKLANLKSIIKGINASPELIEQVLSYYEVLRRKKNGVIKSTALYTLPTSLRMELKYDINIVHLQNSLLLKNQPEPFLRKVSLIVKHVFLVPGDAFFHQGVVKDKIVFITSGVLEILSDEDDHSPIISFKKGTVLGEVALLMSCPAKATVRAATYVELQIIERQDFMRLMLDHVDKNMELRYLLNERLQNAEEKHVTVDKDYVILNLLVSNTKETRPIKLLKERLTVSDEKDVANGAGADSEHIDGSEVKASSSSDYKIRFYESCLPLYQLSENVTMIERPKVCLTSTFPWLFDPRSSLIYFWNLLVNLLQIALCIIFPLFIAFERRLPESVSMYGVLADVIYIFDIYIRCHTAVFLRNKTLKKFKPILNYQMSTITFYVDVFSLFPIETLTYLKPLSQTDHDRFYSLLKLNRILRIWRLKKLFDQFEEDLSGRIMFLRILRYTTYLVVIVFYGGTLLYLETCLYSLCKEDGWYFVKMKDSVEMKQITPCYENPVAMSIYFATMALLLVGYGDILPESTIDFILISIMMVLGIFILCYITAQVCANFSLTDRFRRDYQDNIFAFAKFLEKNNLMHSLHARVISFFELQWFYDRASGRDFLRNSAPPHLRSALQITELKDALGQSPLFQMVDMDLILLVAEGARVQILPCQEVIAYAGDIGREMYILLEGHCEVLTDSGSVLNVYGPGAQFGVLEMIYGISKRYTTRTVTNCKIVCIDYKTFMQAMSMFPSVLEETRVVMNQQDLTEWVQLVDKDRQFVKTSHKSDKKANIVQKHLISLGHCLTLFFTNSFILPGRKKKNTHEYKIYKRAFKSMGKFRIFGLLLMPMTIHPRGPFIRLWCAIRVCFIMVLSIVVPFYLAVIPYASYLYWIVLATDICAYIDIYFLMHMAYYNEKGLLITHPVYTARHYLTHSFIVDLLAVLPIKSLIILENPEHNEGHDPITDLLSSHVTHCTWHLNSLLQFHRVHELFHYLESDILKKVEVIRLFKMLPITLILINLGATLVFGLNCVYDFFTTPHNAQSGSEIIAIHPQTNVTYYGYLQCKDEGWFRYSQFYTSNLKPHPEKVYLVAVYWITNTVLGVGTGDVAAQSLFNMCFVVFLIIVGRMLFALVFANLVIGRAQFSATLLKYQEGLKYLIKFLKQEGVDRYWQRKIFKYFDYLWKRTAGVEPQKLCQKLNTALMEDMVIFLYEKTLREVPLFENVDKSFIRVIAKHLTEQYFLKGDTLVRSFDIQSNIYIIYRGKVDVLTSYHEMIACMGPGGLFGNIRQINPGCSSVTITASRNVDVLVISSETFYAVLKDYPRIKRNMDLLLETVTDYIMPTTIIQDDSEENIDRDEFSDDDLSNSMSYTSSTSRDAFSIRTEGTFRKSFGSVGTSSHTTHASRVLKNMNSFKVVFNICIPWKWFRFAILPGNIVMKAIKVACLLISYFDIITILYVFVTQSKNLILLICSLTLESVFYLKIFLSLHQAYVDKHGNYVARSKKIIKMYFKDRKHVFWDIIPNLPLEPFCFLFQKRMFALSCLRLIHLLRMEYMMRHFKEVNKTLMTNFAVNHLLKILLFLTITIHVFSCAWLMIACPFGNCSDSSWVSTLDFTSENPFHRYLVSLYYTVSLASSTGIGDIYPNSSFEILFSVTVMLVCKFLTALVIGDIVTIINISSNSLVQYEHNIFELKDFLRNQNLSNHQMDKFWFYVRHLWKQEKGQHIPAMLQLCPYVLKCDIMTAMFGQHLRKSFLFKGINEDLLRQLALHLTRIVFLKGNYIVQHGDTDQNMYFIHSGEVSVLTVHPNLTETQHEVLGPNDMFGLAQGLYHGLPHHFSFRGNTKVNILVLNLDSWYHMLKYFPKDQELIYNRAQTVYINV